ncbi:MAG: hypothetical protein KG003_00975 [Bacteroidetes bacterium]|nr:hypothetical protein [Bacteroidota bacterium]
MKRYYEVPKNKRVAYLKKQLPDIEREKELCHVLCKWIVADYDDDYCWNNKLFNNIADYRHRLHILDLKLSFAINWMSN